MGNAAETAAGAAGPFRDYGPGWIRRTAMPEYTAARRRLDHATFRERADASVRCTGLEVKLVMKTL